MSETSSIWLAAWNISFFGTQPTLTWARVLWSKPISSFEPKFTVAYGINWPKHTPPICLARKSQTILQDYRQLRILTQVPPYRPFSTSATILLPLPSGLRNSAALLAAAIPPEPPPSTKKAKCLDTAGAMLTVMSLLFVTVCFSLTKGTIVGVVALAMDWNEVQQIGFGWKENIHSTIKA